MSFIKALALIVIAVLCVVFVIFYIRKGSGLPSGTRRETEAFLTTSAPETETAEELRPGLNTDSRGRTCYVEDDGVTVVSDRWMELDGALYYFNKEGFMETDGYAEGAMEYRFSEDGRLESVIYNSAYRPEIGTDVKGYPGLVKTPELWAFISEELGYEGYYPVMYVQRSVSSTSHQLGGPDDPQYSSPFSIQVLDGYIYYLAVTDRAAGYTTGIEGKLYRMSPENGIRQLVAENADGYKAVRGENGAAAVYVSSQGRLLKCTQFVDDISSGLYAADGVYLVDVRPGDRALLVTGSGFPVLRRNDDFTVGSFVYSLSPEGEIKSVQERRESELGDAVYYIQTDTLFGNEVSRIVRRLPDGTAEIISSEFYGHCGNIHSDAESGRLFAEYTNRSGTDYIIRISDEGDVDYLIDNGSGNGKLELIGIQGDEIAVCERNGSDIRYLLIRAGASVPLAPAVDPVPVSEIGDISETPPVAGENYDDSVGRGPGSVIYGPGYRVPGPQGPGSSGYADPAPGSEGPGSQGGTAVEYGPGVSGAVIGGAP